jgi:stage II sporulation protein AB (anti-sigma F factor)
MKAINTMNLTFDSLPVNESFARSATAGFFSQLDPTVEELCDLRTAVSEAVTNSIVHGYRTAPGKVRLIAKILPGRRISITVKDSGCGIENIEQVMEPLFTTDPEGERSGLGFSVMQSFMDTLRVTSAPGKGTSVTMQRTLSPLPEEPDETR